MSGDRLDEAEGLLERIKGYGLPSDRTREAEARLAASKPALPSLGTRVDVLADALSKSDIRILLVGGHETQAQYDAPIRAELGKAYPRLQVEFEHTGWGANWGRQLEAMEGQLDRCDAVVIMRYIRTMLGRNLRIAVGERKKLWVACTGHGRDSCLRSILQAARQVAQKRTGSQRLSRGTGGAV